MRQTNGAERAGISRHDDKGETSDLQYLRAFIVINPYPPDGNNVAHNPKVAGSNPAPATT
jgi:hypothetical protein